MPRYTRIKTGTEYFCVCNDCGAYAPSKKNIKHHKTCKAGEGKRWAAFYRKTEEF